MSKSALTQMEIIAVLMNGGHIVWKQPTVPGRSTYAAYLPGGRNPDKFIGRIQAATIESLWKAGFLVGLPESRKSEDGYFLMVFKLHTPNLPFFSLDQEVSDHDQGVSCS